MSRSETYLSMQLTIADELGARTDLLSPLPGSNLTLSPIKNAIQSAIAKWERDSFYFNELYDTNWFTTVAGQEFYNMTNTPVGDATEIASMPKILKVHALVNSQRYYLNPRTWQYLEEISVNPNVTTTIPIDFAYFASQIRLYPIPVGAIPMTVSGNQRLVSLVNDTDANVWTQDGFDLIRCEAKLYLAQEVLYDDALATRMKTQIYGDPKAPFINQMASGWYNVLKFETADRTAGPRIRPSYF